MDTDDVPPVDLDAIVLGVRRDRGTAIDRDHDLDGLVGEQQVHETATDRTGGAGDRNTGHAPYDATRERLRSNRWRESVRGHPPLR